MEHGAWSMGHGAWGMEHGAWGMEHGAWSMGHRAEGTISNCEVRSTNLKASGQLPVVSSLKKDDRGRMTEERGQVTAAGSNS